MHLHQILCILVTFLACFGNALPQVRKSQIDPGTIRNLKCGNKATKIANKDINRAILGICGSIAGKIQKCQGNPRSTTGVHGTARFNLVADQAGNTINVSKGRWERCIATSRSICGDIPFTGTCVSSTTNGGSLTFSLSHT
ncbi:hypothetical protein BJ742DRAFT_776257 [Cladochytrium replicatum]|nr:hypothetical protein BJ742DRAFT_776257 [Cladochytrium replicatum]